MWLLLQNAHDNPDPESRLVRYIDFQLLETQVYTHVSELRRELKDDAPRRLVRGSSRAAWTEARVIQQVRPHGYRFMPTVDIKTKARGLFVSEGSWSAVVNRFLKTIPNESTIAIRTEALSDVNQKYFMYVDDSLIRECGRINARAYRYQMWRGTAKTLAGNIFEKPERNRDHCKQNPYTLLMLKAFPIGDLTPDREAYLGLSHIIPLTDNGYERYVAGEIKDNTLHSDVICKPGVVARALVLFSLGIDTSTRASVYRKLSPECSGDEWKAHVGFMLAEMHVRHLHRMMELHDGGKPIEWLVQQNEGGPDVLEGLRLAGFRQTPHKSGDGCCIWSVTATR